MHQPQTRRAATALTLSLILAAAGPAWAYDVNEQIQIDARRGGL